MRNTNRPTKVYQLQDDDFEYLAFHEDRAVSSIRDASGQNHVCYKIFRTVTTSYGINSVGGNIDIPKHDYFSNFIECEAERKYLVA